MFSFMQLFRVAYEEHHVNPPSSFNGHKGGFKNFDFARTF